MSSRVVAGLGEFEAADFTSAVALARALPPTHNGPVLVKQDGSGQGVLFHKDGTLLTRLHYKESLYSARRIRAFLKSA